MKFKERYSKLSDRRKLAVFFLIQWLYWFAAWWIFAWVWPDKEDPMTIGKSLFHATWMALWMTPIFRWKQVKAVFGRRRGEN